MLDFIPKLRNLDRTAKEAHYLNMYNSNYLNVPVKAIRDSKELLHKLQSLQNRVFLIYRSDFNTQDSIAKRLGLDLYCTERIWCEESLEFRTIEEVSSKADVKWTDIGVSAVMWKMMLRRLLRTGF
jgi:hypothetical protein